MPYLPYRDSHKVACYVIEQTAGTVLPSFKMIDGDLNRMTHEEAGFFKEQYRESERSQLPRAKPHVEQTMRDRQTHFRQ
jgi:hypothetical protein